MEFRILGPFEVRADGHPVALPGAKPRALLAALVVHANESVRVDRLALAVWGEDAPATGSKTVQVYVSRLRKARRDAGRLETTPGGYRLRVPAHGVDAHRFETQVATARAALAAGRADRAAKLLRDALALWRGQPLANVAWAPFAAAEIARLEELRWAAVEMRVEADLAGGRDAELVGELQQLTRAHPWRERLHAQLMLALYRSGRQADALAAYRHARAVLVGQLGIEPGPELHELHQALLVHDPLLAAPRARPGRACPRPFVGGAARLGGGGPGSARRGAGAAQSHDRSPDRGGGDRRAAAHALCPPAHPHGTGRRRQAPPRDGGRSHRRDRLRRRCPVRIARGRFTGERRPGGDGDDARDHPVGRRVRRAGDRTRARRESAAAGLGQL